jgi:hypothetical protein
MNAKVANGLQCPPICRLAGYGSLLALGCVGSRATQTGDVVPCAPTVAYELQPDIPIGTEDYICYGFDAALAEGATLRSIRWTVPMGGGVLWHHATLYAVTGMFPDGPAHCDGMPPGSISLHVWTPGGSDLTLPDDVGLQLPAEARRFVIELHVLRTQAGPAASGSVDVCSQTGSVAHLAAFFGVVAPVPAIRPQTSETSLTTCTFAASGHLWSIWPHMHRMGRAIQAVLRTNSGRSSTLVRVDPWNFSAQQTYPLDVDISAGDVIDSQCWWTNTTDAYVFPGPKTSDEMCNQGLIGWPAAALPCTTLP